MIEWEPLGLAVRTFSVVSVRDGCFGELLKAEARLQGVSRGAGVEKVKAARVSNMLHDFGVKGRKETE